MAKSLIDAGEFIIAVLVAMFRIEVEPIVPSRRHSPRRGSAISKSRSKPFQWDRNQPGQEPEALHRVDRGRDSEGDVLAAIPHIGNATQWHRSQGGDRRED